MTEFAVLEGDVVDVPSDLLLLKYAQGFYGADRAVATRLASAGVCTEAALRPAPGDFVVVETEGSLAATRVLFLGTPALGSFTYNEMEVFARRAVEKIGDLALPVRVMTTTVHGAGYGLDGGEALQRLVRGFRDGLTRHRVGTIERIVFLTLGQRTARMLNVALGAVADPSRSMTLGEASDATTSAVATVPTPKKDRPGDALANRPGSRPEASSARPATAAVTPVVPAVRKRRVFVAMPFSEEFQNVYEFGIYPAVRKCGFICERVDESHFTGDVLERIRGGIEAADLVIADLTEGRPNVYLEVGYAWGRGVPVIFVAKKGEKLHFDVSTQRCIFYGQFTQFANALEKLIRGIESAQRS